MTAGEASWGRKSGVPRDCQLLAREFQQLVVAFSGGGTQTTRRRRARQSAFLLSLDLSLGRHGLGLVGPTRPSRVPAEPLAIHRVGKG